MSLPHLLLLNFALAAYLTGLVWVVQLVTYPALGLVGKAEFSRYHAAHTQGMGWVVAAPMVAELALAGWLTWAAWRPLGPAFALGQAGLVALVWLVTFFVSVPFHNRLGAQGFDYVAIDGLTRTNWLRTLAWTARLLWLGAVLWAHICFSPTLIPASA
ncbi:hypothetical protein HHL22_16505 [Hymenobacter sp. RP-2-7]|uniref:DUF1772 domain-containing protein n=1 Tax=Hymenobacter polaris TaxID=2682546 RepID=A0A7Y0FNE0_9BACT|nr:hypothetical protein [Hymenobacter polaris]NML66808.1 hypothetical protein [Hymenobacter polaris]